jgi:hypothetical protein
MALLVIFFKDGVNVLKKQNTQRKLSAIDFTIQVIGVVLQVAVAILTHTAMIIVCANFLTNAQHRKFQQWCRPHSFQLLYLQNRLQEAVRSYVSGRLVVIQMTIVF